MDEKVERIVDGRAWAEFVVDNFQDVVLLLRDCSCLYVILC